MNINYVNGILTIDDETVIFHEQPTWPDGTPWADETEARNWAGLLLAWMQDFENNPEPPLSPSQ